MAAGGSGGGSHWDPLRSALAAERIRVGSPSYGEIARRVSSARQADGVSEHAARVARSTVYDVFTLGKTRINLELAREVAAALDAGDRFDGWVRQCHEPQPGGAPAETVDETLAPAGVEREAGPDSEVGEEMAPSAWSWLVVAAACVVANLCGRAVVDVLHVPVYLDMVGTAIAAIALGPWRGAAVGAATNIMGVLMSGWVSLPFALVNVAGALVWGYGVHRFGWGRTLPRFFVLSVAVAAVCTLVAVPILVGLYGGSVGQGQDSLTQTVVDLGGGLATAVGLSNLMTSTADKVISGFVALVVIASAPARLGGRPAPGLVAVA